MDTGTGTGADGTVRNDGGTVRLTNCTISGNSVFEPNNILFHSAILNFGEMALVHCTVVGDGTAMRSINNRGTLTLANTIVESGCSNGSTAARSSGYNIESPADTCGLEDATDRVEVGANELKLGPLQNNGGITETHALGADSLAIDVVPVDDCLDGEGMPLTIDQRDEPRPGGVSCDVGAFEVQP